jgi:hypothetical protein
MLVCTCEIVRIEDALVVLSRCGASWSALEKHLILVIGVIYGLALGYGAGLGSLCRFGCDWSGALCYGCFYFYLVDGQMVFVFAVFTSDSISELLKALGADAKLLSNRLLRRVVSEEDEGLQSCIRVSLLVDAPQDVVEERLEIDGHRALGRLIGASHLGAVVGVTVGGCLEERGCLVGMCGAIDGLRCLA